MSSVEEFYDHLSQNYHLQFADWDKSLEYHSRIIDHLTCGNLTKETADICLLDCSCGIGTQAIGLALRGYEVTATDVSEEAVKRCRTEAGKRNVNMKCGVADFRTLDKQVAGTFDCVISFDNSLPHLITKEDLSLGLDSIYHKLADGGIFLASIRDYDAALMNKTKTQPPYVYEEENGRRIALQIWDWREDNTYLLNLYIIHHHGQECVTDYASTIYKAWTRAEMTDIMQRCGYREIQWLMPEETSFYQPIVMGRK